MSLSPRKHKCTGSCSFRVVRGGSQWVVHRVGGQSFNFPGQDRHLDTNVVTFVLLNKFEVH